MIDYIGTDSENVNYKAIYRKPCVITVNHMVVRVMQVDLYLLTDHTIFEQHYLSRDVMQYYGMTFVKHFAAGVDISHPWKEISQ